MADKFSEEEYIKFWEKKRSKGRRKYALIDGLKWSVSTAVFVFLFQYYVLKAADSEYLWITILVDIAGLFIAGYIIYYYLMWRLYEKKYQSLIHNKNKKNE